jgi:hypothetical protein
MSAEDTFLSNPSSVLDSSYWQIRLRYFCKKIKTTET